MPSTPKRPALALRPQAGNAAVLRILEGAGMALVPSDSTAEELVYSLAL